MPTRGAAARVRGPTRSGRVAQMADAERLGRGMESEDGKGTIGRSCFQGGGRRRSLTRGHFIFSPTMHGACALLRLLLLAGACFQLALAGTKGPPNILLIFTGANSSGSPGARNILTSVAGERARPTSEPLSGPSCPWALAPRAGGPKPHACIPRPPKYSSNQRIQMKLPRGQGPGSIARDNHALDRAPSLNIMICRAPPCASP